MQSYARYRIQGAILDSLREQDWSPRLLRQKERQLETEREKLQFKLGRPPSESELAAGLGISDRQLQLLLRDLQGLEVTSLQEPTYLEGHTLDEKMADPAEENPFSLCQRAEMNGLLEQAMSKLPQRKRQVLDLYYFRGLTMKETGARLGVCESRVSQIHSSAVASLKARMKEILAIRQKDEASRKQASSRPVSAWSAGVNQWREQEIKGAPLGFAPQIGGLASGGERQHPLRRRKKKGLRTPTAGFAQKT